MQLEFKFELDKISVLSRLDYNIHIFDLTTLKTEVKKLLERGIIVACDHESDDEFISLIFLLNKTGHSKSIILDLKTLNKNLP